MKIRKASPLCKRNPQTYNDEDHEGKLLHEYYNAIPGMELQIEKLLESFHVSKYDYKITHLLIDIIQNETIKILRNAKNIKKNGLDRRLFIKADPTKKEDTKEDHTSPDLVRSSNNGDGTKKEDASKGMVEGQEKTDQSKVTTHISKDASGVDVKGGVIGVNATLAMSPPMATTPVNERDGEVEKQNKANDAQGDGMKGEPAEGSKEESQANLEHGEGKKEVEAETIKTGQTEDTGQAEQTGQTEQADQSTESFSIFKSWSNYFGKKSKTNEDDGGTPLKKEEESAPDKAANGESTNRDAIEGAPKLNSSDETAVREGTQQVQHPEGNSRPNEIENNVNPSGDPSGDGSHFVNNEKNNVKEETYDTSTGGDAGMAPNRDQVGSGLSEGKSPTDAPQNSGEKKGAKDQAQQTQSQPVTAPTAQEEVLVIDEESINLAIKEYVLKYIYKKKNVDFLYDEVATQQKESNSAGIVERNVRYPTGFPPYLPDDCSINTILPAWDIKYNFNSSKGENYQ
ncbi:hypothetical protein AK88_03704 [Plasmodium fragile]|uniref:Uncharacterized protein n=1 Tax=Plasmodium fragile TaxID=5857 RepID=A0A0D9QIT2_PLAFR|nr:uncharacterized protein AK88_03704 [Plasmodium fragile]KJP86697.1 hypothetical protein AK88_03704 [Plasmodium fragile]